MSDQKVNELCAFGYTCNECGQVRVLHLPFGDVCRWKAGELIQNVFPQLSEDDRELMISGTCGKCFAALFDDMEEQ